MIMRMMQRQSMSEKLAQDIDKNVARISAEAYEVALSQLLENRVAMDAIVEELCEVETMDGDRFREMLSKYVEIPVENRPEARPVLSY